MRLFGLIGFPLSHSFSKKYFTEKFVREGITDAAYELFELPDISQLPALLTRHPDLRGLNVTIPHKQHVIPLVDHVDQTAARIGAVNVIKISSNGETTGYNSDYFGFQQTLMNWLTQTVLQQTKALILGTGGASKAVKTALDDLGVASQFVSRQASHATWSYEQLDEKIMNEYLLIINTTPLGMSPQTETFPPIPYDSLTSRHFLYDLVYNPEETTFLQKGKAAGAQTLNGLPMLHAQAEKSWQIWNSE